MGIMHTKAERTEKVKEIKAENEKIYYIIDALNEAINRKKRCLFSILPTM